MKRALIPIVLIVTASALYGDSSKNASSSSLQKKRAARGEYLVIVGGCHDCHSPKSNPAKMEPDMTRILSGRPESTPAPSKAEGGEVHASGDLTAWYGPWGVSYTANLTPDPETGLKKRYTEAAFIKTIRTGMKPEGTPLLPPMPWPNYAKFTDEDLKSIWAYLQTIPPVKNFVRTAAPPAAPTSTH